jgi:hypothetical protein
MIDATAGAVKDASRRWTDTPEPIRNISPRSGHIDHDGGGSLSRAPAGVIVSVAKKLVPVLALLLVAGWTFHRDVRATAVQPSTPKATVVVELFTSEGCSSCPPADAALTRLVVQQPVAGVQVLALGEHVDYWDRLGWRDPFSSAAYSARQSTYDSQVFHRNEVYTPQLVVDGQLERVGSDVDAVQRAVKQVAQAPKAIVDVAAIRDGERALRVNVHVTVPPSLDLRDGADVVVAITEDNLATEVRRGENRGRTLRHSAVVRRLTAIGTLALGEREWSTSASVPLAADWSAANIRVISFLQERESRRIVGAGSASGRPDVDSP